MAPEHSPMPPEHFPMAPEHSSLMSNFHPSSLIFFSFPYLFLYKIIPFRGTVAGKSHVWSACDLPVICLWSALQRSHPFRPVFAGKLPVWSAHPVWDYTMLLVIRGGVPLWSAHPVWDHNLSTLYGPIGLIWGGAGADLPNDISKASNPMSVPCPIPQEVHSWLHTRGSHSGLKAYAVCSRERVNPPGGVETKSPPHTRGTRVTGVPSPVRTKCREMPSQHWFLLFEKQAAVPNLDTPQSFSQGVPSAGLCCLSLWVSHPIVSAISNRCLQNLQTCSQGVAFW